MWPNSVTDSAATDQCASELKFSVDCQRGTFALRAEGVIPPGLTLLSGPSGAGKSTLLWALAGLLAKVSGTIALGDRVLLSTAGGLPSEERHLALVAQEPLLFPHLSLERNVYFGFRRGADRQRVETLIERFGLATLRRRRVYTLSLGEQRRVSVARALASFPRALLLDEPLVSLDPLSRQLVIQELASLSASRQLPILCTTHQLDHFDGLDVPRLVIENGRLLGAGDENAHIT